MHRPANVDSDDEDEQEEGYLSELQTILQSITRRMIKSELEDFELVCIQFIGLQKASLKDVQVLSKYASIPPE